MWVCACRAEALARLQVYFLYSGQADLQRQVHFPFPATQQRKTIKSRKRCRGEWSWTLAESDSCLLLKCLGQLSRQCWQPEGRAPKPFLLEMRVTPAPGVCGLQPRGGGAFLGRKVEHMPSVPHSGKKVRLGSAT